jgi:neuronal calcium sensor 1
MIRIVSALYKMLGDLVTIQGEEFDSPERLVDKIFEDMDAGKGGFLTFEQYRDGAMKNSCIVQGLGLFGTS